MSPPRSRRKSGKKWEKRHLLGVLLMLNTWGWPKRCWLMGKSFGSCSCEGLAAFSVSSEKTGSTSTSLWHCNTELFIVFN